jgi:hypothetical protein
MSEQSRLQPPEWTKDNYFMRVKAGGGLDRAGDPTAGGETHLPELTNEEDQLLQAAVDHDDDRRFDVAMATAERGLGHNGASYPLELMNKEVSDQHAAQRMAGRLIDTTDETPAEAAVRFADAMSEAKNAPREPRVYLDDEVVPESDEGVSTAEKLTRAAGQRVGFEEAKWAAAGKNPEDLPRELRSAAATYTANQFSRAAKPLESQPGQKPDLGTESDSASD